MRPRSIPFPSINASPFAALDMPEASRLAGVYLLTPDADPAGFERVLTTTRQALDAGVRAVQYRNKMASGTRRVEEAGRLIALARAFDALAIVNDDLELALAVGADGLHLGKDDGELAPARTRFDGVLGASCYDDLERAGRAVAAGADALAFGSMFVSSTKPGAVRAPLALLTQARSRWPATTIIAIGGITAATIASVAAAGAHAAALISAVYDAANPSRAAGELIEQFRQGQEHESQRATV
jgi:thiamine-phosphate pyrophosphorylase